MYLENLTNTPRYSAAGVQIIPPRICIHGKGKYIVFLCEKAHLITVLAFVHMISHSLIYWDVIKEMNYLSSWGFLFVSSPLGDACEWEWLVWGGGGLVQGYGGQQDALCQALPTGTQSYSRAILGKRKAQSYEVLQYETVSWFWIVHLKKLIKSRFNDLFTSVFICLNCIAIIVQIVGFVDKYYSEWIYVDFIKVTVNNFKLAIGTIS